MRPVPALPSAVPMTRHTEYLSAFTAGNDTRQLYARDRRHDTVVFLPEGGKDAVWPDCRNGHLVCPVPDCKRPELTAVGGSRRHHYRHLSGVQHRGGAESYYHLAAKAALDAVLRTQHPEAHIQVDYLAVDSGQIPDLLVHFPDDRRYAIEIQYSPLTVEEWLRRHEGYRQQGIVDVWLFGHLRPHLRRPRPASFRTTEDIERCVVVGDLLRAVMDAGLRVRFINPDERAVATVLWEQSPPGLRSWGEPYVEIESLHLACLDADGLRMPADAAEAVALAARRKEEVRRRAEAVRRDRERRLREEGAARRERFKQERLAEQARAWEEARPRFLKRVGLNEIPSIIREQANADGGIYWHPEHWKARLFVDVIQGRIGETLSFKQAARPFWQRQATTRERVSRALCSYLFLLKRRGYIDFNADGYFIGGPIRVLADLHNPPLEPEIAQGVSSLAPAPALAIVSAPARIAEPIQLVEPTARSGFTTLRGPHRPLAETGLPAQALRAANGHWVHIEARSRDVAVRMGPFLCDVESRFSGIANLSIGWPGAFHDLARRVDPTPELLEALEQIAADIVDAA